MKKTEEIWCEYHQRLSTFLGTRVPEDMVEDLLQEIFLKVHQSIGQLKDRRRLESWIFQITRNTVTDYYRSKKENCELPDWIQKEDNEGEGVLIRKELSSCLEPMIARLPEKYQSAILLSEIEGKTQKEVAEKENISLSGAKSRVQRGRALLKDMLFECCKFEINEHNQLIDYEVKDKNCKPC